MDKNIYINDLLNRNSGYSFTETLVNDIYIVVFLDAGLVSVSEGRGLVLVDAYRAIRSDVLEAANPLFQSTTIQRDALTNIEVSTLIDNITIKRSEIWDGTAWKSTTRLRALTGIVASTTQTQGNGLLSADVNVISTVANINDTVTLPVAAAGIVVMIINKGTKKIKIFPNTADDLGSGLNASVSLSAGSSIIFHCFDTINWIST